jgi:hypothetical protein
MPIRREYRWFYPIDWPQLSAAIRFGRAKGHASIIVARTTGWYFTSGMVGGGTRRRPHGGTVGAGALSLLRSRLPRGMR